MSEKIKILLLEDVPDDVGLVEYILKKSTFDFSMQQVDEKEKFIEALDNFIPDVVLSDHSLPQFNSFEALQICKSKNLDIPFILVTGSVSEEFAVDTLKQGADDYILKSNLTRLPSAIENSLKKKEVERNKRATERALKEQNVELTKINQELDRFVYSASHDLRAPLKSVLGLVKLAQDDFMANKFDQFGEYFQMMERSVMKLDSTIKDIINYSRNARTDIAKNKIDFHHLIECVLEDMKYIEGSENMEKIVGIEQETEFYSDLNRLTVILNNLVSNSIKYKKADHPANVLIKVITNREYAKITIKDNGIGIEDIYLDKIFNMFYRATAKSEGSGLGLYIVRETIDKLNGTIDVSSALHEGTTFEITIPNNTNHD